MKLLFDENLSRRILPLVLDSFPGSTHLAYLEMLRASDEEVWQYALGNGFTIVTQDSDFESMSMLRGAPPKVIVLEIGNGPFRRAAMLLQNSAGRLIEFFEEPDADCSCLKLSIR